MAQSVVSAFFNAPLHLFHSKFSHFIYDLQMVHSHHEGVKRITCHNKLLMFTLATALHNVVIDLKYLMYKTAAWIDVLLPRLDQAARCVVTELIMVLTK